MRELLSNLSPSLFLPSVPSNNITNPTQKKALPKKHQTNRKPSIMGPKQLHNMGKNLSIALAHKAPTQDYKKILLMDGEFLPSFYG